MNQGDTVELERGNYRLKLEAENIGNNAAETVEISGNGLVQIVWRESADQLTHYPEVTFIPGK